MTSQKILKYSMFSDAVDNDKFLLYEKPSIENSKSTLYENLDYLDNLGKLVEGGLEKELDHSTYRFFDYIPFVVHDEWDYYTTTSYNKEIAVASFKFLKQYRIRAIFNISENTTVKEAKDIFLSPLIDHLLLSPNILGTLFFINRISTEQISLELFIFCNPIISGDELEQMNLLLEKILAKNIWWFKPPYDYWFYRFYCEIFQNPNLLIGGSAIFSFTTKSDEKIKQVFQLVNSELITDKNLLPYINILAYVLNTTLHSAFIDWFFLQTLTCDLRKFFSPFNFLYFIALWDDPWNPISESDKTFYSGIKK